MKKIARAFLIIALVATVTVSPLLASTVQAQEVGFAPFGYNHPPDGDRED